MDVVCPLLPDDDDVVWAKVEANSQIVAEAHELVQPGQNPGLQGKPPEPAQGWVAYFIELTFPGAGLYPFKFTTGVRVAPDVLPFEPPPEMANNGLEHQPAGSQ